MTGIRRFEDKLPRRGKFPRSLRSKFTLASIVFACLLLLLASGRRPQSCKSLLSTDTVVSSTPGNSSPELSVMVLTHSRHDSLNRLLLSLRTARYMGDRVDLHVWIDRSQDGSVSGEVVSLASSFSWPHGARYVHVWDTHVGLWGQWLDSWRPKSSSDAGLILEDDLEVSPLYYLWLKGAREKYGRRDDLFGYTLQRGTLRANRTGFGRRPLRVPPQYPVFMYKLLGSWGYSPTSSHWQRFRDWFHTHSCDPEFHPYVDDLVPTLWYKKQERKKSMWTMWHIRYAHDNNLFTVYANLPDERTLCAGWREPGLHFKKGNSSKASMKLTGTVDFEILEEHKPLPIFEKRPPMLDWNGLKIQ